MSAMTPIERLTMIVKNFHREAEIGSGSMAAYWLGRFHLEMDNAERDGMRFDDFPLPGVTFCGEHLTPAGQATISIKWGQHNGITNQRTISGGTILVNEGIQRRVG